MNRRNLLIGAVASLRLAHDRGTVARAPTATRSPSSSTSPTASAPMNRSQLSALFKAKSTRVPRRRSRDGR